MDDEKERMANRGACAEALILLVVVVLVVALQRRASSHAESNEQLISLVTADNDAKTQVFAVYALACRRGAGLDGAEAAFSEATQTIGPAALAFMRSWGPGLLPRRFRRGAGGGAPDAKR